MKNIITQKDYLLLKCKENIENLINESEKEKSNLEGKKVMN